MQASQRRIDTLDDLRTYVNQTLCQHDQLELNAFTLTERPLTRSGKPCGVLFCLHGPRAVKFSAIWETERNTILFYNSSGQRFQKTHLTQSPELASVAA